jgi:hypothetical protein
MQAPIYESSHRSSDTGFFATHPIFPVLGDLFLSSLLWIFLAFALYGVYTLIAG